MEILVGYYGYTNKYRSKYEWCKDNGFDFNEDPFKIAWDFLILFKERYIDLPLENRFVVYGGSHFTNKRLKMMLTIGHEEFTVLFDADYGKYVLAVDTHNKLCIVDDNKSHIYSGICLSHEGDVYIICIDSLTKFTRKIRITRTDPQLIQQLREAINLMNNYINLSNADFTSKIRKRNNVNASGCH